MIQPANRVTEIQEYYFSRKLKEVAQLNAEGKDIISLPSEVQTCHRQSRPSTSSVKWRRSPTHMVISPQWAFLNFERQWQNSIRDGMM